MLHFLAFSASLALLLLSARLLVGAAERIGLALGLSSFMVGVIVVGVGTSLPELVTGLFSVSRGVSQILSGNVLGANVSNLLLVLGVSAVFSTVRPVYLGKAYIAIDLHFLVGSAFALGVVMFDGVVGRVEGLFLLAVYGVYVVYFLREGSREDGEPRSRLVPRDLLMVGLGAVGLHFGAEWTVGSVQALAAAMGVPLAIVAVTILALGTTLPELVVSFTVARQGKSSLAVGNILGSCVFNALVVVGAGAVYGTVKAPPELAGFALPFFVGSSLLFYLLVQDRRISSWEGMLFLLMYGLFVLKLSGLA
ncbi:MAG: sodium:calcium antiporter [Meiothermus sp.]|uniref:sodium:calcium antiporter n=1 Tax=Meiothermus sp. TaxID=1955249 RepID=UPI00262B407D|nr:sodium:calcium antiporter [Meiothermus sp.]MCS7058625.1 sodium:calcium antiporter [Meiothermus sp.]MCX7739715.1 sodium:calcium antiporter [Meiothermus sp.]MDW8482191.1 sodium:calcium antiporter [Meiothermus sp.]